VPVCPASVVHRIRGVSNRPSISSLYPFSLPAKPPDPLSAQPSHAKMSSCDIPVTSKTHIGNWPRPR
jgi:hypothetical protein